ncbi:hypothetical protein HY605_00035 [Candidatus Peregrinibacteria bacterium]|nr:hypothetical protein [Candidatus Peregrinibacteria bacterium]
MLGTAALAEQGGTDTSILYEEIEHTLKTHPIIRGCALKLASRFSRYIDNELEVEGAVPIILQEVFLKVSILLKGKMFPQHSERWTELNERDAALLERDIQEIIDKLRILLMIPLVKPYARKLIDEFHARLGSRGLRPEAPELGMVLYEVWTLLRKQFQV